MDRVEALLASEGGGGFTPGLSVRFLHALSRPRYLITGGVAEEAAVELQRVTVPLLERCGGGDDEAAASKALRKLTASELSRVLHCVSLLKLHDLRLMARLHREVKRRGLAKFKAGDLGGIVLGLHKLFCPPGPELLQACEERASKRGYLSKASPRDVVTLLNGFGNHNHRPANDKLVQDLLNRLSAALQDQLDELRRDGMVSAQTRLHGINQRELCVLLYSCGALRLWPGDELMNRLLAYMRETGLPMMGASMLSRLAMGLVRLQPYTPPHMVGTTRALCKEVLAEAERRGSELLEGPSLAIVLNSAAKMGVEVSTQAVQGLATDLRMLGLQHFRYSYYLTLLPLPFIRKGVNPGPELMEELLTAFEARFQSEGGGTTKDALAVSMLAQHTKEVKRKFGLEPEGLLSRVLAMGSRVPVHGGNVLDLVRMLDALERLGSPVPHDAFSELLQSWKGALTGPDSRLTGEDRALLMQQLIRLARVPRRDLGRNTESLRPIVEHMWQERIRARLGPASEDGEEGPRLRQQQEEPLSVRELGMLNRSWVFRLLSHVRDEDDVRGMVALVREAESRDFEGMSARQVLYLLAGLLKVMELPQHRKDARTTTTPKPPPDLVGRVLGQLRMQGLGAALEVPQDVMTLVSALVKLGVAVDEGLVLAVLQHTTEHVGLEHFNAALLALLLQRLQRLPVDLPDWMADALEDRLRLGSQDHRHEDDDEKEVEEEQQRLDRWGDEEEEARAARGAVSWRQDQYYDVWCAASLLHSASHLRLQLDRATLRGMTEVLAERGLLAKASAREVVRLLTALARFEGMGPGPLLAQGLLEYSEQLTELQLGQLDAEGVVILTDCLARLSSPTRVSQRFVDTLAAVCEAGALRQASPPRLRTLLASLKAFGKDPGPGFFGALTALLTQRLATSADSPDGTLVATTLEALRLLRTHGRGGGEGGEQSQLIAALADSSERGGGLDWRVLALPIKGDTIMAHLADCLLMQQRSGQGAASEAARRLQGQLMVTCLRCVRDASSSSSGPKGGSSKRGPGSSKSSFHRFLRQEPRFLRQEPSHLQEQCMYTLSTFSSSGGAWRSLPAVSLQWVVEEWSGLRFRGLGRPGLEALLHAMRARDVHPGPDVLHRLAVYCAGNSMAPVVRQAMAQQQQQEEEEGGLEGRRFVQELAAAVEKRTAAGLGGDHRDEADDEGEEEEGLIERLQKEHRSGRKEAGGLNKKKQPARRRQQQQQPIGR